MHSTVDLTCFTGEMTELQCIFVCPQIFAPFYTTSTQHTAFLA